jgi:RNA polymerase sigma factor (sigma-70 family)
VDGRRSRQLQDRLDRITGSWLYLVDGSRKEHRMIDPAQPAVGPPPPGFAEFYRATAAEVQRFMTAFAGSELGHEATAESYARILERWPNLHHLRAGQLRAYVMTTAKNYVRRHASVSARFEPFDEAAEPGYEDPALDRIADRLGVEYAVRSVIDSQPERRRQVALLYFLDNDTYAEIAQYLGISESTVRSHVAELRRVLQPYVRRYQELMEVSGRG